MHGENGLIKVESADGTFTMTYDADGLRRRKQDASATVNFIWDGLRVLLETDAQNATVAAYSLSTDVYGDLVSQRRSGASSFYHFDALGSTDRLTGADGSVTDSYVYYAFGQERASSGTTTNPYRYVGGLGYYRNGTDLLYLSARYYLAALGRFFSRDRLAQGLNRYAYVRSSPVIGADPSGLFSCNVCIWICASFAGGLLGCLACWELCERKPKQPELETLMKMLFGAVVGAACKIGACPAEVKDLKTAADKLVGAAKCVKDRQKVVDTCKRAMERICEIQSDPLHGGVVQEEHQWCEECCVSIANCVGDKIGVSVTCPTVCMQMFPP